jgi:hypothetical protein
VALGYNIFPVWFPVCVANSNKNSLQNYVFRRHRKGTGWAEDAGCITCMEVRDLTVKMEAESSSEMAVDIYQTTWRYTLENTLIYGNVIKVKIIKNKAIPVTGRRIVRRRGSHIF